MKKYNEYHETILKQHYEKFCAIFFPVSGIGDLCTKIIKYSKIFEYDINLDIICNLIQSPEFLHELDHQIAIVNSWCYDSGYKNTLLYPNNKFVKLCNVTLKSTIKTYIYDQLKPEE